MIAKINTAPGRDAISALLGLLPQGAAFLRDAGTNEVTMDPCAFLILLGHSVVLED